MITGGEAISSNGGTERIVSYLTEELVRLGHDVTLFASGGGVKFGRPPKLNQHQRREAIERLRNGETQAELARTYGVDATTIGRLDCAAA